MGASRMSRMRSASTSARGSGSAFDGCDSSPADKGFWTIFGTLSEKPSKPKNEPSEWSSGKLLYAEQIRANETGYFDQPRRVNEWGMTIRAERDLIVDTWLCPGSSTRRGF